MPRSLPVLRPDGQAATASFAAMRSPTAPPWGRRYCVCRVVVVVVDEDEPSGGAAVVRSVVVVRVTLSGLSQPATRPVLARSATAVKNRRREWRRRVWVMAWLRYDGGCGKILPRRAWPVRPARPRVRARRRARAALRVRVRVAT